MTDQRCRICGDPWPCSADHTGATDLWTGEPLVKGPIETLADYEDHRAELRELEENK